MTLTRLLLLNFTLATYLTGVIWVVQLVTYPAMALVGKPEFMRHHAAHTQGMGWVVGAPMVLELALAGWLAWAAYPTWGAGTALGQLALVLAVWAVTFFISVPFHNRLAAGGFDYVAIDGLVRTNWLRTLAWTARAAWLGWLLSRG
ncbi:hypothetical protein E4631_13765 [Hymenobacter sp. UV11]|uniref:hypothetical protein n=1 Tax=Hymenobacter sp. UV11 TaxID=1849735 RepID=UPI00105D2F34|nr:hypothetical protein [Hymenobacter sp. UV11]TDN36643.1 hypothetical protein A8B98_08125 [Hymenobacter sp. UV11]TFZ66148.1 hypothetical protein E4631_13765 [Hymenobacter sp. UV11]